MSTKPENLITGHVHSCAHAHVGSRVLQRVIAKCAVMHRNTTRFASRREMREYAYGCHAIRCVSACMRAGTSVCTRADAWTQSYLHSCKHVHRSACVHTHTRARARSHQPRRRSCAVRAVTAAERRGAMAGDQLSTLLLLTVKGRGSPALFSSLPDAYNCVHC